MPEVSILTEFKCEKRKTNLMIESDETRVKTKAYVEKRKVQKRRWQHVHVKNARNTRVKNDVEKQKQTLKSQRICGKHARLKHVSVHFTVLQ